MIKLLKPVRHPMLRRIAVALVTFALVLAARLPAAAADPADQAHSLRLVPADAAYYSASLRLREQLEIFLQSRAYARLMEIPVVQLGRMQATFQ